MSDTTSNNSADYVLLTRLADEFAARYRAGERPALKEYTDRYPHLADEIHELFPAMVEIEQVKEDHQQETEQAAAPEFPGLEQVGDFRIIREVGKGGMGVVYEAEQVSLGRHVALKALPKSMLLDAKAKRRFEREAKSAAKLHHTNIVPVFGVGEQDGMPYYVMQFIQGLGLDDVLDELKKLRLGNVLTGTFTGGGPRVSRKEVSAVNVARSLMTGEFQYAHDNTDENTTPVTLNEESKEVPASVPFSAALSDSLTLSSSSLTLPGQRQGGGKSKGRRKSYWRSVASIGVQVADALEYAHKQGVHHRDVKPSNLLLDTQATVWVTDFGLAKANDQQNLTHTGDILGTLRYMPPEAFEGHADARSDLYSLGLTLYEMLAFRPAFDEKERNRLIKQVTTEEPTRLGKLNRHVPQDLETIVHKAIERDPKKRYASAGELAEDLQRFIEDEPIKARRVSPVERAWRWCMRNPALATTSGIAAAGLVAVTIFATLFAFAQSSNATREARSNKTLIEEQQQTRAERDRAEKLAADLSAALNETKKHEALLAVEKGQILISQGQLYPGMLWMARGLENTPADAVSLQDSIRTSLAALRSDVPVLGPVIATPGGVIAAAFSPDGKMILTGGGAYGTKGEARLWDAATGQPLGPPLPHDHQVHAAAFSPDGKTVYTGSGDHLTSQGVAQRWDATNGKPLGAPLPHNGAVWTLEFSPDGKTILAGALDFKSQTGEIRLWDAASGVLRGNPLPQIGPVESATFFPDGKTFVSASSNSQLKRNEVRLWDAATVTQIGQTIALAADVCSVAACPDGKTFVTGTGDLQSRTGEVRFWDRATGQSVRQPWPHPSPVYSLAMSADGKMLVTGSGDYASVKGEVRLWETSTGKPLGAPIVQEQMARRVGFSPDGRTIFCLSTMYNQPTFVWELPTDRLIGPVLAHQERVSAVAFSPDGNMIVTGTGTAGKRGVAQRWGTATGLPIGPPLRQPGYVRAVAFSGDGTKLLTGTGYLGENRGEAQLWDAVTGRPAGPPLPHGNDVTAVAFSPDGQRILTGSLDKTARLYDVADRQLIGEPFVHPQTVTCVAFSPDGDTILTGAGKQAWLWNARTGKPQVAPLAHQGTVTSVAFSPGGQMFATACEDRLVFLWDRSTLKPIGFPFDHPGAVTSVAFSPDGKLVLTGCRDNAARVWDARTGLAVGTSLRHPRAVTSIAFSPDGQTVLTGCEDGTARLWDAATHVTGENARLVRWVEVQSGMELSPERAVRTLDEATREERRESLAKLGGPLTHRQGQLTRNMQQAFLCIDAENWGAALWHLNRQIDDHPRDTLAFALRTRAHLEQEHLELAAADFDSALALGPQESVLPFFRAFATDAIEKQRGQRAFWYLDRLVRVDPRDASAWIKRGRLLAQGSRWPEAAADMARGLDLDPAHHWNWFQAIPLQLYCGDEATYRRLCRAVLEQFGDRGEALIADRIARACLLMSSPVEDRKRLCELADRAIASHYGGYYIPLFEATKGMAEYRDGRFQSAIHLLQKNTGLDRNMAPAIQSFLAMAYHRLGQSDKARQALEKAKQFRAQLSEHVGEVNEVSGFQDWMIGQICYREAAALLDVPYRKDAEANLRKHEWSAAALQLEHLIEADSGFWPDWVARSCAHAELGRYQSADADFAHALALARNEPYPWLQRGRFHLEMGRPDKAAVDFARALELVPEGPGWEIERSAVCQDLFALEPIFAKIMALQPNDGNLYLARARSLAKTKTWDKALDDYDRAALLKPGDLTLRLERGDCLANLGRWDRAAADYEHVLESNPDDVDLWYQAAMAQLAAGKTDRYGAICSRLWGRFGKTVSFPVAQRVGYALVASSLVASKVPAAKLEVVAAETAAFGPALVRAGKWEDAIREFEQPAIPTRGARKSWSLLFQAMAHHRLGHAARAREDFDKAKKGFEQAGRDEKTSPTWAQRIEFQTVFREAEALLKDGPSKRSFQGSR